MSEINVGAISEALNNKVDLPTPSTPQDAVDYVIEMQRPTADNNYTWYRKYKSGWVEQGGLLSATVASITLPVEMIDDNYPVQLFYIKTATTSNVTFQRISTETQTTTGFTSPSANSDRRWQVCGISA